MGPLRIEDPQGRSAGTQAEDALEMKWVCRAFAMEN